MNDSDKKSNGIGFVVVPTIIFIIFKLTNVIDWSWIWIVSPLWIPFAIALVLYASWMVLTFISEKLHAINDKLRSIERKNKN